MAKRKREPAEKAPDAAEPQGAWFVSGPGAADFLTAQGGLDRPETDAEKGTGSLRDDTAPASAAGHRLVPDLEAPEHQQERWIATGRVDGDEKPDR